MHRRYQRSSFIPALVIAIAAIAGQCACAQLTGGILHEHTLPGEDSQQGFAEDSFAPSGDPFSQDDGSPEAPAEDMPPRSQAPFNLGAEEGLFPSTPIKGAAQAQQPEYDPDCSPDMQLLWDQWHRRIAGAVFERYHFFAKAAFARSRPLKAVVRYAVTRDGKVTDVQLIQKSSNFLYNMLVQTVVRSMNGDLALLQFPPGSRRQYVVKHGVFSQNVGQSGFRYTTGDRERL